MSQEQGYKAADYNSSARAELDAAGRGVVSPHQFSIKANGSPARKDLSNKLRFHNQFRSRVLLVEYSEPQIHELLTAEALNPQ